MLLAAWRCIAGLAVLPNEPGWRGVAWLDPKSAPIDLAPETVVPLLGWLKTQREREEGEGQRKEINE